VRVPHGARHLWRVNGHRGAGDGLLY
jgi:hypothetical protein